MHRFLLAGLVVFSMSVPALSQQPAQQSRPRVSFQEVLRREDANKDGTVTKEEFKASPRLFERFDRNGDGVLTKEDFAGNPPQNRNAASQRFAVPEDVEVLRDVVYGQGGGRDLKMDIVLPKLAPKSPCPAYVWIHGGGWQNGTKDGGVRQVAPLVRDGFIGATIEYRLTGEAPFPAQIEDCKCAIRYLRAHAEKYHIDPSRIAIGGSSAGGHLVALMGTSGGVAELEGTGGWPDQSSRVQAVVDMYGPTDFQQFVTTKGYEGHNRDGSPESKLLGGGDVLANPEGIKRVNPITYVDKDDPPFLTMQGSKDSVVLPSQAVELHEALNSAPPVSGSVVGTSTTPGADLQEIAERVNAVLALDLRGRDVKVSGEPIRAGKKK